MGLELRGSGVHWFFGSIITVVGIICYTILKLHGCG